MLSACETQGAAGLHYAPDVGDVTFSSHTIPDTTACRTPVVMIQKHLFGATGDAVSVVAQRGERIPNADDLVAARCDGQIRDIAKSQCQWWCQAPAVQQRIAVILAVRSASMSTLLLLGSMVRVGE